MGSRVYWLVFAMMLDMAFFGNGVRLQAANQLSGLDTHKGRLLAVDDFSSWQANWVVEAELSSWISYREEDSLLDLVAEKGLTLWYKKPFSGNLSISYEAYAVQQGGPYDRVSDLNCFWMAVDPCHPDDLFARKAFRQGVFGRYYSLVLYYLGYGGNQNTTTRFRKYDGKWAAFTEESKRPPVLMEYTDSAHLLKPNQWYQVKIIVQNGRIQYWMNGERLVDYMDSQPLTSGWFGFRTTQSHFWIRSFKVIRLD